MAEFTPSKITFVGGYGYGIFPYPMVLQRLFEAMKTNHRPNDIWINSGRSGKPELFIDQGRPDNPFCRVMLRDTVSNTPSEETIAAIKAEHIPVMEASLDSGDVRVFYPASYRIGQPYSNRVYVKFGADCYDLVKEYLAREFGIKMPEGGSVEFARRQGIYGDDFIYHSLVEDGFQVVMTPQPGDIAIVNFGGVLHLVAFTRDGKVLHHMAGRFSCVEEIPAVMENSLMCILRKPAQ